MIPARLLVRATILLLRLILALYPRDFRRRFGPDALDDLRTDLDAAARDGVVRVLHTGARATRAAIADLIGEHYSSLRGARNPHDRHGEGRSPMPGGFDSDLTLALRRIRTQPLLALAVVLTLGLAIGASTSIFSVADAVLLRPLPFPSSDQLVRLEEVTVNDSDSQASLPAVEIWSREVSSLESVMFYEPGTFLVVVNDEPDRVAGATVSRTFLDVLKTRPVLGSGFSRGPVAGPPDEVLISHSLYQRLGGRPELVGATLPIDPGVTRIVGVMPPEFAFPADAQFWRTPTRNWNNLLASRTLRFVQAVGRLRAGTSLEQLRRELAVLTTRYPAKDDGADVAMAAVGLRDFIVERARTGVVTVTWAVAFLLVIASCNVAALRLVAAVMRRRDAAVQTALGASPGRLLRQSALEILLVVGTACALGLAIAWVGRDAIVALSLAEIPRIAEARIDLRALAFAAAATVGCAALATFVPVAVVGRVDPAPGLRGGVREGGQSKRVRRALQTLLIAQVALAFVITAGGVLLTRTLHQLSRVETGFAAPETVALRLTVPIRPRMSADAQRVFHDELRRRVLAMSPVRSAAYVGRLPLARAVAGAETIVPGEPAPAVDAIHNTVGPGYFATIGAHLVAGREIAQGDYPGTPVVVLNDVLARRLFPAGDAVGRRIVFQEMRGPLEAQVVGVVRALRYNGLAGDLDPELFIDYRVRLLPQWLIVRSHQAALPLVASLKAAIREVDPTNRVTADPVTTLEREVDRHLARPRFFVVLSGAFAVVALALVTMGLYGVMAFTVAQRRHEIGVRLALGAAPSRLFASVMRSGFRLTAVGLLLGLAGAVAVVRMMQSLLFGVEPLDAVTFAAAIGLVAAIALVACWVPASRARATDPLSVLRTE